MEKNNIDFNSNNNKKYQKVFWETFIILCIAFLYVFHILCVNHGYDFTQGMGGIVYLFVFLILIVAFFFLIVNVLCGIKCFKNRDGSINYKLILFLMTFMIGFYIYLWIFTLSDSGFIK